MAPRREGAVPARTLQDQTKQKICAKGVKSLHDLQFAVHYKDTLLFNGPGRYNPVTFRGIGRRISMTIAIVDYGMGNLRSVSKALEHLGAPCEITCDPGRVAGAE